MSQSLTRRPGSKYSAEQIENGIVALAQSNGSSRLAHRLLADQGVDIPIRTLQWWKTYYAERLSETEKRVEDEIWRRTSRRWRRVIEEAADGTTEAIEAARKAISPDNPELADPKLANAWSSAAKNLATAGGIATDKAAGIDGRPMHHIEARGLNDALKTLERYPGLLKVNREVIDGDAQDVTDAQSAPALATRDTSDGAHPYEQTEASSPA